MRTLANGLLNMLQVIYKNKTLAVFLHPFIGTGIMELAIFVFYAFRKREEVLQELYLTRNVSTELWLYGMDVILLYVLL